MGSLNGVTTKLERLELSCTRKRIVRLPGTRFRGKTYSSEELRISCAGTHGGSRQRADSELRGNSPGCPHQSHASHARLACLLGHVESKPGLACGCVFVLCESISDFYDLNFGPAVVN